MYGTHGCNKYIARAKQKDDGSWEIQTWLEHSKGVAELAGMFASKFGNEDWGRYCGLIHDTGKLLPDWQTYIRRETGYGPVQKVNIARVNHSTLGAFLPAHCQKLHWIIEKTMAYITMGHHAGLPDFFTGSGASLTERFYEESAAGLKPKKDENEKLQKILETSKDSGIIEIVETPLPSSVPAALADGEDSFQASSLWIRMLFSCLVDADRLDAERCIDKEKYEKRSGYSSLAELKQRFDTFIDEKTAKAEKTNINSLRARILASCRDKAKLPSGFFTLSVPTGSGKTLASMAFALNHALEHGKDRIIVAIPYTSIIEQTAKVYKYGTDTPEEIKRGDLLFGEENVLEHHSNIDTGDESEDEDLEGRGERLLRSRLASENWDVPIIVTTNVQLFESLAASKPSRCRKLHNIANSVIILDEAQMLPPEYLSSIVETMKQLVKHFKVTVVLCTATQPMLKDIGTGTARLTGIQDSTELADEDREGLFSEFKRVNFYLPQKQDRSPSWKELAEKLCEYESVLCVVNTRRSARDLHAEMPDDAMHLSAHMCAEDRSDVIAEVKEKLKNKVTVRLISTQLIEAGVDIDFPVVYRAYAGIDSLVQAAGRCNREGKTRTRGKVFVFEAPVQPPVGPLRKGADAARLVLNGADTFEPSDELFRYYFQHYYGRVNTFDKPLFNEYMIKNSGAGKFQFRTYAEKYKLIDDTNQKTIIVPFHSVKSPNSSLELLEQLERGRPWDRYLARKLQRFTVTLYELAWFEMYKKGYIKQINEGGAALLQAKELYKPGIGLLIEDPVWADAFFA